MDANSVIDSFLIDHTRIKRGVYVSRVDKVGEECVTTYDIRVSVPPHGIDGAASHTIEHIAATFLRNGIESNSVIYFGPMGCLTGFYLIMAGEPDIDRVVGIARSIFHCVSEWPLGRRIPGMSIKECGNPMFHNIVIAKSVASEFLDSLWETEYPKD